MKRIHILSAVLLFFSSSWGQMVPASAPQTVLGRDDPQRFNVTYGDGQNESLVITSPPFGVQAWWPFYRPNKYVKVDSYNLHVFGTPSSSEWMIKESTDLIIHMISALKRPEDRAKFSGHQLFCITDEDPDLTLLGSFPGHRNTGMKGRSLFNEVMVCATTVDSIRPAAAPIYRAWNTPVHELGHAIEQTLKLESRSDEIYSQNVKNYNPKVAREYFAWATQRWFKSIRSGKGRESFPKWEYDYLASVFSVDNQWVPVDADGPDMNIPRWNAANQWPDLTASNWVVLEGAYQCRSNQNKKQTARLRIAGHDSQGAPAKFVWENQEGEPVTLYPDSHEWVLKTDRVGSCYANRLNSGKELYVKFEQAESDATRTPRVGIWFRGKFFVKE